MRSLFFEAQAAARISAKAAIKLKTRVARRESRAERMRWGGRSMEMSCSAGGEGLQAKNRYKERGVLSTESVLHPSRH